MTAGTSLASHRLTREFEILNQRGLHARASAKFVQTVAGFDSAVEVEKDGIKVGGASIMGLMMLAAGAGSRIRVSAEGPDAAALLDAVEALVASRFGEEC